MRSCFDTSESSLANPQNADYGRNGWCDGLAVARVSFEVGRSLAWGATNELAYHARSYDVGGGGESAGGCGGYILMSASLAFY